MLGATVPPCHLQNVSKLGCGEVARWHVWAGTLPGYNQAMTNSLITSQLLSTPNPATTIATFETWNVRVHADGTFDAEGPHGLSAGFDTLPELLEHLRRDFDTMDADICDQCGRDATLYHNEETKLTLCGICDEHAKIGSELARERGAMGTTAERFYAQYDA